MRLLSIDKVSGLLAYLPRVRKNRTNNSIVNSEVTSTRSLTHSLAKRTIRYSKVTLNTLILIYVLFAKAPLASKLMNKYEKIAGKQPRATYNLTGSNSQVENNEVTCDSFVKNYRDFDQISQAIGKNNWELKDFDLNKNGVAFDNRNELQNLRDKFQQSKNVRKYHEHLIEEINLVSQLIWGEGGPNPDYTDQAGRDNCKLMADIQGHFLTNENIQHIKGSIKVTDLDLSKDNFRLDVIVNLNGENIYVPFEELVEWMSPGFIPSNSKDGSLSVPIFTYAIEKGLTKYSSSYDPASSLTLVSGKDYCSVYLPTLSDSDLIRILSQAPNTTTKLATSKITWSINDLNLNQITNYWKGFFEKIKQPHEPLALIKTKENQAKLFVESIQELIKKIKTDKPIQAISIERKKPKLNEIVSDHMYVVKEFKKINGEYITTVIDSNSYEFDLTLNDIREHIGFITSESQNFPNLSLETYKALFLALTLVALINLGSNKLYKKLK